ncbi:MAG: radical SAM protein [Candidatus Gracilibacteria bacterium]|jgi:putative pyruvate formate lyase activating enzyme
MTDKVKISWFGKHFGEEPPFCGSSNQGAGGIFFTGCNLRCVFCQNYQISQGGVSHSRNSLYDGARNASRPSAEEGIGRDYSVEELAEIMIKLQKDRAVNIDLVTPTIWFKQIKEAIRIARKNGLKIPILWNSNAYEKAEMLCEMEGLVDIYLPDFKYGIDEVGLKYSGVANYSVVAIPVIKEMIRQVGNLQIDLEGVARRGVVVRHLVLPGNLENSLEAIRKLAEIDMELHVSLMNQYFPMHKAKNFPEVNRVLTKDEFDQVFKFLLKKGFQNGWVQDEESREVLIPDFTRENPFRT